MAVCECMCLYVIEANPGISKCHALPSMVENSRMNISLKWICVCDIFPYMCAWLCV